MATTWADKGGAGYLTFDRLSAKLRYYSLPLMPLKQFVREETVIGSKKGDTLSLPRIYPATRAYPTQPLSETSPIPVNDWTQGKISLVVKEWGDSFDNTEKFSRLADFDPNDPITRMLQDSIAQNQSYLIATELKKTAIKYAPTDANAANVGTFKTDGTDPGAFARSLGVTDLFALRDQAMDVYRIPPLKGPMSEFAQYAFVCSQSVISQFMKDSTISNALNYSYMGSPKNPLLRGSLGVYNGIVFYLDTMNFATKMDTSYTGEGVFFGDDAVVSSTPLAPELRRKTGVDYGRDPGVAWYGIYNYTLTGGASQAEVTGYLGRAIHVTTNANA